MEEAYIGQEADDTCMHGMQMVDIQCLITEDEASDGQVADDICMHGMQMVEIHCLTTEDEEDDGLIKGKELPQEQVNQDYVDLESQEQQSLVIDIDSLEHEYGINEAMIEPLQQKKGDSCSTRSAIPWAQRRKLTSERGRKKVRQQKRNIRSRRKPQTGTGREAYLMNNENTANMMEGETQYVDRVEQEEEDSMDKLIEEVCMELEKEEARGEPPL